MLEGVTWFRQSSIRIRRGGVEIHIDPWGIPEESTADYILLTHPHFDNFSEDDIARVRGPETTLVAPASMRRQLEDVDHLMRPGDMIHLDSIEILAVPAYNTDKKFHPAENEWLGYVFTLDGITYYHSGDTDFLEAMSQIRCDVAFLPCGGHYTMGPEDAVRAANACQARAVVPVHWGGRPETRGNAERVKEMFGGEVVILEEGMPS